MRKTTSTSANVESEDQRQPTSMFEAELIDISDTDEVSVEIDGVEYSAQVLSHVAEELGRLKADLPVRVLVSFPEQSSQPVIVGVIQSTIAIDARDVRRADRGAKVDGERLQLTAQKEIELRCGSSSIVLKRDGRILIKGSRLVSRASGVNKVKGASVQIN